MQEINSKQKMLQKNEAFENTTKAGVPKLFEEQAAVNLSRQHKQCWPKLENSF